MSDKPVFGNNATCLFYILVFILLLVVIGNAIEGVLR